jgi:hypothetical protein
LYPLGIEDDMIEVSDVAESTDLIPRVPTIPVLKLISCAVQPGLVSVLGSNQISGVSVKSEVDNCIQSYNFLTCGLVTDAGVCIDDIG